MRGSGNNLEFPSNGLWQSDNMKRVNVKTDALEFIGRFPLRTLPDQVIPEEAEVFCSGDDEEEDLMVEVYQ